jgi:hypothetical protein
VTIAFSGNNGAGSGTVTQINAGDGFSFSAITGTGTIAVDGNLQDLDALGAVSSNSEMIVGTGAGAYAYESGATLRSSVGIGTGDSPQFTGIELSHASANTLTASGGVLSVEGVAQAAATGVNATKQCIAIACSDETTDLTTGTAKATFHMPYAFTLTAIKAGLTTAPTGSVATFDVNEAGSTILTTKLTIDIGEKTSATAATAAVIGGAGPALAADALMTVDVDGIGSSTAGAGLKIYLIGYIT